MPRSGIPTRQNMLRRPHYIALAIVVLVTVVIVKLPSRTASRLRLAVSSLFVPLFGAIGSTEKTVEKAGAAVVPRTELLDQVKDLQKEVQQLRLRAIQLETLAQENTRLRAQLQLPKHVQWKPVIARVVAVDPANWWRTVRIDRGSRDGVVTNCPVLTLDGLVGRVAEVGFTHSRVVLVGDPDCRVSVLIEETREHGVIAPTTSTPLDPTIVELGYLSRHSKLAPGQRVVTSGMGGIFPKGIVVGHIVDFRSIGYGLYNEARVKLQVNMNTLEEVWVKLP
jgi:rod shape-determining protein MreC